MIVAAQAAGPASGGAAGGSASAPGGGAAAGSPPRPRQRSPSRSRWHPSIRSSTRSPAPTAPSRGHRRPACSCWSSRPDRRSVGEPLVGVASRRTASTCRSSPSPPRRRSACCRLTGGPCWRSSAVVPLPRSGRTSGDPWGEAGLGGRHLHREPGALLRRPHDVRPRGGAPDGGVVREPLVGERQATRLRPGAVGRGQCLAHHRSRVVDGRLPGAADERGPVAATAVVSAEVAEPVRRLFVRRGDPHRQLLAEAAPVQTWYVFDVSPVMSALSDRHW